uniref:Uncharacterized protein n=1 Tax=Trypanosoma vivax (strain Y486) TaxID=1055687 RepID=G0TWI6_TRYVY|nr:conserved hypothetical protein, fragment [Trypanosoma vivax Y486]
MQQKVLIASPVSLFEVVDGNAVDRGNCACAIVTAAPGGSLKYSLVCYNERRETLCVAHLTADIAQTIQFQVNAETHANFRDSSGRRWNCVFPTPDKLRAFLAALGTAAYALAGQPTHSVYTVDFSPLTGGLVVQQQHRVRVRYWTYGLRGSEPLMLGELLETSGEELYTFRPALSSAALLQQDNSDFLHLVRGFECGIVGTFENSLRAIVLPPQAVPLSRQKSYGTSGAAFVVQVVSILQDDISAGADGAVPTVFSSDDYHTSAGSGAGEASNTGIIVLHPEGTSAVGERDVTSQQTALQAPDLVEAGGGVPTAHMALLQKLGVHLSSATSCAIDVRSITGTAVDVWRQTVDRPKPSRLTNEALQQAVQQLILENERVANGLVEKDELLRALDRRNRELQQRVDAAALSSQQLLDEKNDTVRMASDMRLEKERGIMQVQQQINQVALDRDDTQRHLLTVKQLLTASEEQLHKLRSDANMQNEKQESTEEAVRQLMLERDGAEHCELSLDERRARYTITREMESFFADLAAFLLEQQTSRDRLLSDVESALAVMLDEYAKYITDLRAWRVHEMEERQHLRVECARAYVDLLTMEEMAFRSLEAAKVAGALAVDQGNLVAEEEGDRISIDSEQGAEWSSLCSAHDIAMTSLVRSAAIVKDQQSIINEEEEARVRLLEEEAEEVGIAMKELDEVLLPAKEPSLPSPPPVEEAADAGQPIEDVEKLEGDSSTSVSDTLEEEKGEEVVEVAPVVKAEVEDEDEDGDEDEDEDESSEEDSEEQEQRKVVRRPMEVPPPPIQEAQAKTEVSRKKKLFDSSSDEEGPSAPLRSAAPPPPPPAARSRMPPSRTALPDLSDYSD